MNYRHQAEAHALKEKQNKEIRECQMKVISQLSQRSNLSLAESIHSQTATELPYVPTVAQQGQPVVPG